MGCHGVFIVGCARSGTTAFGRALGHLGFADLGEPAVLKVAIPELLTLDATAAARAIDGVLASAEIAERSDGLPPAIAIPEMVFLVRALSRLEHEHRVIHLVRDPRDVISSLLEKGWLSEDPSLNEEGSSISPDWATGNHPRFWTETERRDEFPLVSEARRAAWAWRRHVEAGLAMEGEVGAPAMQRYEPLCLKPEVAARVLSPVLERDEHDLVDALEELTPDYIGRWHRNLKTADLADLREEASSLLARLDIAV